jgi:hypothetical protein
MNMRPLPAIASASRLKRRKDIGLAETNCSSSASPRERSSSELSPPKPKEITWILREKPDGTYEEEVAGKYDTFDAPVKALTSLFSEGAKEG